MMFSDFDGAFRNLARQVRGARESSPRGMWVREQLGVTFSLTNPRARLVESEARKPNYGFAAGEFCWYLRGACDVDSIAHYAPGIRQFSDDGETLASAYGNRTRVDLILRSPDELPTSRHDRNSQWQRALDELVEDPDSRRAVIAIYQPSDLVRARVGTRDVPCTLALQFFTRDEGLGHRVLHMHVTMRSCDLVWGLTNDVFSFTLLQEVMLLDLREAGLDVEMGDYIHTCGSLHAYERHFDMLDALGHERAPTITPTMPAIVRRDDLDSLLKDERDLRMKGLAALRRLDYGGGASWLYAQLAAHAERRSRTVEAAVDSFTGEEDPRELSQQH